MSYGVSYPILIDLIDCHSNRGCLSCRCDPCRCNPCNPCREICNLCSFNPCRCVNICNICSFNPCRCNRRCNTCNFDPCRCNRRCNTCNFDPCRCKGNCGCGICVRRTNFIICWYIDDECCKGKAEQLVKSTICKLDKLWKCNVICRREYVVRYGLLISGIESINKELRCHCNHRRCCDVILDAICEISEYILNAECVDICCICEIVAKFKRNFECCNEERERRCERRYEEEECEERCERRKHKKKCERRKIW